MDKSFDNLDGNGNTDLEEVMEDLENHSRPSEYKKSLITVAGSILGYCTTYGLNGFNEIPGGKSAIGGLALGAVAGAKLYDTFDDFNYEFD